MRPSARVGAVLTALVVVACSGQPSSSESAAASLRTPSPPSQQPTFEPDELTAFLGDAAGGTSPAGSDLDQQWSGLFEALDLPGERPYQAPSAVLGFRAGDIPDTACGRSRNADRWRNNAAYCKGDQRIVYDEDWLRAIVQQVAEKMQATVGSKDADAVARAAALSILAHEWGHHVQWLLDRNELDIAEELQADCLSGMYLEASGVLPHDDPVAETAALDAAMGAFFTLGNTKYKDSEWFAADQHGSPIQRIMATSTGLQSNQHIDKRFVGGMEKGLPFCYGYLDYDPRDNQVDLGGPAGGGTFSFVELPGRAASTTNGIYVMEPESRTGQPGSFVRMNWVDESGLPLGATAEQVDKIWEDPSWQAIQRLGEPQTISASIHGGTGVAVPYQHVMADGSDPQTGLFGLLAPADGHGALLIIVYQTRLASSVEEALPIVEETFVTMTEVTSRLCTPDESDDPSASNFDPVCSDVQ